VPNVCQYDSIVQCLMSVSMTVYSIVQCLMSVSMTVYSAVLSACQYDSI